MRNVCLLFLFILIGLYNPILSQNKFTPDAEKFLKEVQSFIGEYDKTIA